MDTHFFSAFKNLVYFMKKHWLLRFTWLCKNPVCTKLNFKSVPRLFVCVSLISIPYFFQLYFYLIRLAVPWEQELDLHKNINLLWNFKMSITLFQRGQKRVKIIYNLIALMQYYRLNFLFSFQIIFIFRFYKLIITNYI